MARERLDDQDGGLAQLPRDLDQAARVADEDGIWPAPRGAPPPGPAVELVRAERVTRHARADDDVEFGRIAIVLGPPDGLLDAVEADRDVLLDVDRRERGPEDV